jgi:hypothetical protein
MDALADQTHYKPALKTIETVDHQQLAHLALAVAAEAVAQEVERTGNAQTWVEWWHGVDSPGVDNPDAADTSPALMWRIMRPDS